VILTGWKEISKHIRYGIRTLQRWEGKGLPVKRVNNSPRSPVVGDPEELDAWILHWSRIPPGAPQSLVEVRGRARELTREVQRNRRALRVQLGVFRKELAMFRAKTQKMIANRDPGGVR